MPRLLFGLNWVPFILSLLLFAVTFVNGSSSLVIWESLFGLPNFRLELLFDTLSTTMLLMITMLSGVLGQYAYFYLDKQKRQSYFYKNSIGVILSVVLMVFTSNLIYILLSWVLASVFLSRCLLYNKERPQAQLAVKKKFWISRIGDLSLLASIIVFVTSYGSTDIKSLTEILSASQQVETVSANWAVFLLCLAAVVKAVQFPFHLWLPETMETPTPISALMHAGVVNSGGFLLIRASSLLVTLPSSLIFVAFIGAFSAAFGSLVMLTQNDIKKKLAYSTISQMGMMIFACGVGAFSIAMIHIVAHSLYKAYAFLSTGNLIEESRYKTFKAKPWSNFQLLLVSLISLTTLALGFLYLQGKYFSLFLYGAVLILGVFQCLNVSYNRSHLSLGVYLKLSLLLTVGFIAYGTIETYLVSQSIDFVSMANFSNMLWLQYSLAAILPLFIISFWVAHKMMQNKFNFHQNLYFFLLNGAYLSQITSRFFEVKNEKGAQNA